MGENSKKVTKSFVLSLGITAVISIMILLMPWSGMKVQAVDWTGDVTASGTINESVNIRGNTTLTLDGDLNITGGIIIDPGYKLTINGNGTLQVGRNGLDSQYVINIKQGSTLEIDGAEVNTVGNATGIGETTDNNSTIIINSGRLIVHGTYSQNYTGIKVSNIAVNGGSLETNSFQTGINAASLTINGGKVDCNAGDKAIMAGTMTVENGTVIAQGGALAISAEIFSATADIQIEAGDSEGTAVIVDAFGNEKYVRITKKQKLVLKDDQKPTGKDLQYNGQAQSLLNPPKNSLPDGYTMKYILGDENAPSQGTWDIQIPAATDPGTYYVWFKAEGSDGKPDSDMECIRVTIADSKSMDVRSSDKTGGNKTGVRSDKEKEKTNDTHSHKFVWETKEPTENEDGELRYVCEICGAVEARVPLTAYTVFSKNTASKIRNAGNDATIRVETSRWISFHKMVMEALSERPDVTLEVSFLDEEYKGNRLTVTIPNGTNAMTLVDENGFTGFLYLADKFGVKNE